jgi:putative transcriptional regulator
MVFPESTDLLIAPPNIPDPRFRRTVLMLTHEHRAGSFALCINRETGHTLKDLLDGTGIDTNFNFPIYWGGPVNQSTVWMLHSDDWRIKETVPLPNGWAMTSNSNMFSKMSDGQLPRHFRIMFGFCSWGENQLRCELEGLGPWRKEHSWLVAKNLGTEWLFETPVDTLWESATTLCSHQAVDSWL